MLVIGLMSGTSADGVDVALCRIIEKSQGLKAEILASLFLPYDAQLRQRILDNCDPSKSRVDDIAQLHADIANEFTCAILKMIESSDYELSDIDLIGSHGHTLWHNVLPDGEVSVSLQVGEAAIIAEKTGITTISNFRSRDVAAGGQGAPLTSYVDYLLLRHATKWRAIQNIGGMGNVTFLPPYSDEKTEPIAFDTGPGNALIDVAVSHFTNNQQNYDKGGQFAAQGRVSEELLEDLLAHPYYRRSYPKTTGREVFGTEKALEYIAIAQKQGLAQNDIIATLTALTAASIAEAYREFAPGAIEEVILGGGGHHNSSLVRMLETFLAPAKVMNHEAIGISSDFKEALVFAVLAHETWQGRNGTLPSLTGATHGTIAGNITPGANYERLLGERRG